MYCSAGVVVEICAIVYQPSGILCAIDTPFDVQLSIFDGSAGKSHIAAALGNKFKSTSAELFTTLLLHK